MMHNHTGREKSPSDDQHLNSLDLDDVDTAGAAAETQHAEGADSSDDIVSSIVSACIVVAALEEDANEALAEHSSTSSKKPRATTQECLVCWDGGPNTRLARTPCSHLYCQNCLSALFKATCTDIGRFPPRCCRQEIPPSIVDLSGRDFLERDILNRYSKAEVLKKNQTAFYCSRRTCSSIIAGSRIHDDVATCPNCDSKTCTRCHSDAHEGQCPEDPTMQQLQQLAQQKNWTQCVDCRRWVERTAGCSHMSKWRAVQTDALRGASSGPHMNCNSHFVRMPLRWRILLRLWPTLGKM